MEQLPGNITYQRFPNSPEVFLGLIDAYDDSPPLACRNAAA
jgi:hypothetical protein